jgi:hypothetical protein
VAVRNVNVSHPCPYREGCNYAQKLPMNKTPHKLAALILQMNALLEAQERRLIEQAGSIRQHGIIEVDKRYGMNES